MAVGLAAALLVAAAWPGSNDVIGTLRKCAVPLLADDLRPLWDATCCARVLTNTPRRRSLAGDSQLQAVLGTLLGEAKLASAEQSALFERDGKL